MTAYTRQGGQTLILIATWLFFAGNASSALVAYSDPVSSMESAVKHVIADPPRKEAILNEIKLWEDVQDHESERIASDRKTLLKALRVHNTQRAEVDPVLAKLDETFGVMDWDFLNLRYQIKQQVTSAEWAMIVAQTGS